MSKNSPIGNPINVKMVTIASRCVVGWAFVLFVLQTIAGCSGSSSGPKTYPVKGTVKFADGKPVTDGNITFFSKTHSEMRGFAIIKADGSFTLSTTVDGKPNEGAVAGEHTVKVMLLKADDVQPVPLPPIDLPETYTVKESDDNHINIVLKVRPPT